MEKDLSQKEKKSKKLVIHSTQYITSVLFLLRSLALEHIKHSHLILSVHVLCCTLCLTGGSLTEKFLSNTNKVVFYLSTALWTATYPRFKLCWRLTLVFYFKAQSKCYPNCYDVPADWGWALKAFAKLETENLIKNRQVICANRKHSLTRLTELTREIQLCLLAIMVI